MMGEKLEYLNYTDHVKIIDALEMYIASGHKGIYVERLREKMKRNAKTTYEIECNEERYSDATTNA